MKVYREGKEIFEIKDYKQVGRFMEVAYIDCTVKSATPIDFTIGDYVVFDYNGLTYSIYDMPSIKKQSRSGSYGEAFTYELKFKADTEQLAICPFLDLVLNDNEVHFTSLPSFSTYENVYGIVARLQANMDYLFPDKWLFVVHTSDDEELMETLAELKEYSISGESCFDGLKKIYDTWGVGYIHTYQDGKNIIIIGKSAGTTSLFRYGKGQGLRTIKKNLQNQDQLCTRVYAYGSTRNMPARWYNEKGYIGESQYAPNLMIPPTKWADGKPQGAYIDAIFGDDNRIKKYGLKIKTFSYDGSDSNKDEIFPSVEKVTIKNIRDAKAEIGETDNIPSSIYEDNERVDYILSGTTIKDNGVEKDEGYVNYTEKINSETIGAKDTVEIAERLGETKYNLKTYTKTFNICSFDITKIPYSYRLYNTGNIFKLKKNDYQSNVTIEFFVKNPNGEVENLKGSLSMTESLEAEAGISEQAFSAMVEGKYSVMAKMSVTWTEDYVIPEVGEDVYLQYTLEGGVHVQIARGQKVLADDFTISIKQIGFNISDYTASDGTKKTIHIKNGMCGGRTFNIKSCTYVEANDSWTLECVRNIDESLSQRFPNSIFPICEGDQFVLLNINMPDLYVYTNMQRLYDTALADLKYYSLPQYVIEPEIDNIQMARSPQILREGMYMPIEDEDMQFNAEVLIDSVTINNKGTELSQFEVALRNDKIYNKLSKLASRIADLESSAAQAAKDAANKPVSSTTTSSTQSGGGNTGGGADVDLTGYATEKWVKEQDYLTEDKAADTYAPKDTVNSINSWFSLQRLPNGAAVLVTPHNIVSEKNISSGGIGENMIAPSILREWAGYDAENMFNHSLSAKLGVELYEKLVESNKWKVL